MLFKIVYNCKLVNINANDILAFFHLTMISGFITLDFFKYLQELMFFNIPFFHQQQIFGMLWLPDSIAAIINFIDF